MNAANAMPKSMPGDSFDGLGNDSGTRWSKIDISSILFTLTRPNRPYIFDPMPVILSVLAKDLASDLQARSFAEYRSG